MARAERAGRTWGAAFVLAGLGSCAGGTEAQLAFAAAAIGTVGLLHGASDVAIVPAGRRALFLLAYLAVVAAVLAAWRCSPVLALAGFLILSAWHFAVEDAPADASPERLCRGLLLTFGPALLHRADLAGLFASLTDDPAAAQALATAAMGAGAAGLALLPVALLSAERRAGSGGLFAVGAGAAVLLPPLVGFAVAFMLLHAWPQLRERMAATASDALPAYLVRHRIVLAGAAGVVALAAALFADRAAPALTTLFAGLAALATPHMLVTPLFEARAPRPARSRLVPG